METFRVGIDFRGAQSSGGSGQRGIGRYTTDLVKGLLEFGPQVIQEELGKTLQVVLFHTAGVPVPAELGDLVEMVPIHAPRWDSNKKPLWMRIPKLRSMPALHQAHLERTIEAQTREMSNQIEVARLDLMHLPTALDVGSYPAVKANCPVVMTVLDTIILSLPEIGIDRYPRHLQWFYRHQILNLARASRLIAISEATKADVVRQFGFAAERIDVVYPAVSPQFGEDHLFPSLPELQNRRYFLFCSVPDPHKNPRQVIEAFSKLDEDAVLVFVSPKDHPASQEAKLFADSLRLSERFLITGFVEEAELYRLFRHAIALVSPSQMEGFGLPVAQAMRSGTPVITSNRSAQAELADGIGALVEPKSVEAIVDAMRLCIAGYPASILESGKKRAELFCPESVTRKLLESYLAAIGGTRTSSRG